MNGRTAIPIALSCSTCPVLLPAAGINEGPQKIRALAQIALAPIPQAAYSDADRQSFISGFSKGYLSGLTNPKATPRGRSQLRKDPWDLGFEKGRNSSIAELHAGRTTATLPDFGFTEVTRRGYLFLNFEQNEFRPVDSRETWWLSPWVSLSRYDELIAKAGGHHQIMKLKGSRDFDRRTVYGTLHGYLSPKKDSSCPGYGHFGMYDREFVVNRVIDMEPSGE